MRFKMPQLIKTYTPSEASNYVEAMSNFRNPEQGYLGQPFNFAEIIRERFHALKTRDIEAIKFFLDQYFDTPDAFAYPGKSSEFSGRFKFVPDSDLLLNIGADAEVTNGALELSDDEAYAGLKGPEFRRVDVDGQPFALLEEKFNANKKYKTNELYEMGATPINRSGYVNLDNETSLAYIDETVNSDLWLAFLRGDKKLLTDYRNAVSEELNRRKYDNPNQSMGVYLGSEQEKPSMRALFVDDLNYRSNAGGDNLLSSSARLVGVSSKIAEGDAQNFRVDDVEAARLHLRSLDEILSRL